MGSEARGVDVVGAPRAAAAIAVPATDALAALEQPSRMLTSAYGRLEEQVRRVNRELERANLELTRGFLHTETMRGLLDLVLASVPCGILSCDLGGTVTTANPAMTAMLGRPEGSLLGMSYDAALGGWADVRQLLFGAGGARAGAVSRERRLARGDGSSIAVESLLAPLVSDSGEPAGAVEVVWGAWGPRAAETRRAD